MPILMQQMMSQMLVVIVVAYGALRLGNTPIAEVKENREILPGCSWFQSGSRHISVLVFSYPSRRNSLLVAR